MDPSPLAQEAGIVESRVERLSWPLVVPLFATTLFLGLFLMFMVEPMIAKMVLPILGGAPMVWNTCVVFFQTLLLAGYAYAHGTSSWLHPKRQSVVYSVLLILPLLGLPFRIHAASGPVQSHPILWLFVALATSIGPAFFVLSTASSVFQKLFSTANQAGSRDPYFLYAASNLGSLVALASYPTLVEPTLRLDEQIRYWTVGYAFFAIFAVVCACSTAGCLSLAAGLACGRAWSALNLSQAITCNAHIGFQSLRREDRGPWEYIGIRVKNLPSSPSLVYPSMPI